MVTSTASLAQAPRSCAVGVEIRSLRPDDFRNGYFETLAALRDSGLTPDEASQILRARPDNVRTFVLLADGQVAATATLVVEQKFIHRGGVAGHVEDVATRPGFAGHGYATMLLERLLAEARAEGCYKVILDCDPDLVAFYHRIGFRDSAVCMRIDL